MRFFIFQPSKVDASPRSEYRVKKKDEMVARRREVNGVDEREESVELIEGHRVEDVEG